MSEFVAVRAYRPGRFDDRAAADSLSAEEREARIRRYTRRAAAHLPLFDQDDELSGCLYVSSFVGNWRRPKRRLPARV